MKSSAISLRFLTKGQEYLVNVIDTPGHIDFAGEVSTAVRLCDGACILIDAVEGVCPQTKAVLRQIWIEGSKPCLIINKIDRLISELKMTTGEAHEHLKRILEQVNAFMGELFGAGVMKQANKDEGLKDDSLDDQHLYFSPEKNNVVFGSALDGWAFRICDFAKIYSRKMGLSESSLQATLWGDYYLDSKKKRLSKGAYSHGKKPLFEQFVLDSIWSIYDNVLVKKDALKVENICTALHLKVENRDRRSHDRRVYLKAIMSQWLPLANAVLEMVVNKLPSCVDMKDERIKNLLYTGTSNSESESGSEIERMKQAFRECDSSVEAPVIIYISKMATVNKRFLRQRKIALTAEEIKERSVQAKLRHKLRMEARDAEKAEEETLSQSNRKSAESPTSRRPDEPTPTPITVAASDFTYTSISASATAPTTTITTAPSTVATTTTTTTAPVTTPIVGPIASPPDEDDDVFIAFARIFSGQLRRGQKLLVLSPKYNPYNTIHELNGRYKMSDLTDEEIRSLHHAQLVEIGQLYMFMGMEMKPLDMVPAGNIVGIGGLQEHVINSAALSDSLCCTSFSRMYVEAKCILRVAVEPRKASDMTALVKGLHRLNQADAWVNITEERSGELVISATGQVHLEKCINDLTQNFAKIEVNVSDPIVPYRETIVWPPVVDAVNEAIVSLSADSSSVSVPKRNIKTGGDCGDTATEAGPKFKPSLEYHGLKYEVLALPLSDATCSCIEKHANLITDDGLGSSQGQEFKILLQTMLSGDIADSDRSITVDDILSFGPKKSLENLLAFCGDGVGFNVWSAHRGQGVDLELYRILLNGFTMATEAGPLCEEPMRGVGFIVKQCEVSNQQDETSDDNTSTTSEAGVVHCGKLISNMSLCCRQAFQAQDVCPRIVIAMNTCTIQTNAETMGKLYSSLSKRGGCVVSEELTDNWSTFNIVASIPLPESHEFAIEIRKKTSGLANPSMQFSHWQVLNTDPFWVPTTDEEYRHFGSKADTENTARRYVNAVRRRKGLRVDEHIVEFAEKQRNLTKNK